ncbi:MAG: SGNH/GDSL hydrolase family protein [Anaerolineae bacterium]
MRTRLIFCVCLLLNGIMGCTTEASTPLPVFDPIEATATATLTPTVTALVLPSLGPTLSRALSASISPSGEALAVPMATLGMDTAPTPIAPGDTGAMERRLRNTPILYQMTTSSVRTIFENGRLMGNRADVFTVIGDSNSSNGDFMYPLGLDQPGICEYGDTYAYLQDTTHYFSTVMDGTAHNSFTHDSQTADRGFNTESIFDPFWASDEVCAADESPLMCEYRTTRPAAAVIMLGGIDVNSLDAERYGANMRAIVEMSIRNGVVPILTTFVVLPDRDVYPLSLEFNMALLDIAERYQIPVINLWAAAQALPDMGIGPDHTHLKAHVGSFCDFTGAEQEYGGTLRNLLTLEALDMLRRDVFEEE